jgi:hypothetical protein
LVRIRIDSKSALESAPQALLGYKAPQITSITHDACVRAGPNTLTACPRAGGTGRLTLSGTNFGAQGAVVLVGAELCTDETYNIRQTEVTCVLPSGIASSVSVLLIQSGGAVSNAGNTLSLSLSLNLPLSISISFSLPISHLPALVLE